MAKNISPIFKLQGTIDDLTFVNSKRYKPHVRARKNSKTPFVMTASLAESKARLQACNQYAKPVFQALRAESHDGGLWSRLVSQLFAELKADRPLGLECLQGFECNLQHPLGEVINKGYDLSATGSQNQLGIYVQLHGHPKVEDGMPRTGYQLRFVAIMPDAASGTVKKVEVLGPLTKYKDELMAHDLKMELPGNGAPYILLMGIVPHLQGEGPAKIMSDSGMKVVWVEGTSGEGQVASGVEGMDGEEAAKGEASSEWGGASGRLPEMREDISANEVAEVVAFGAEGAEKDTAGVRAKSRRKSKRAREKTSENRTTEVVALAGDAAAAGERQAMGGHPEQDKLQVLSGRQPAVTREETSMNEVAALAVDTAAAEERLVTSGEIRSGRDKLQAGRGRREACAACPSHALAPAKVAWDGGGAMVSGSTKKGPEPLLIDATGDRRKGLPTGADHENAAPILPLKSRLTGRPNNEDDALLNTHQRASSGSHEIILHNKTFN
jgi:hypothetical protein